MRQLERASWRDRLESRARTVSPFPGLPARGLHDNPQGRKPLTEGQVPLLYF